MSEHVLNDLKPSNAPSLSLALKWDCLALWLPLLGVLPLLVLEAVHLWDRPHLQFFPITLAIAAWLSYKELPLDRMLCSGPRYWVALLLLGLSLALNWGSLLIYSPWLAHVGVVVTFVSWGLVRLHATSWPRIIGVGILLASTIPLPLNIDRQLIADLQSWSSKACAYALDALHIPNLLQGNVLQIENHSLFVEEACSGVTSLYSLISLALLFNLFQHRSLAQSVLTLSLTPLVAINGNILRLLVIALGFEWWNIDLTSGLPHSMLGMIVFGISGIALLLIDFLVASLLAPIPKTTSDKSMFRRIYNSLVGWPSIVFAASTRADPSDEEEMLEDALSSPEPVRLTQLGIGRVPLLPVSVVAYALLLVPTTAAAWNEYRVHDQIFGSAAISVELADQFPDENSLPEQAIGGWRRAGYKVEKRETHNQHGQYSHVWRYVKGEQSVIVSLDFAFRGWHSLESCYTSAGWRITKLSGARNQDNDSWPWLESQMTNELGLSGYLWFSLFDDKGKPFVNNMNGPDLERRMGRNFLRFLNNEGGVIFPFTFQTQLFVESGPPMTEEQLKELQALYLEVREIIRQKSLPLIERIGEK